MDYYDVDLWNGEEINNINFGNYILKDIKTETCTDEVVVEDIVLPNGKTKTVERKQRVCEIVVTLSSIPFFGHISLDRFRWICICF